MSTCRPVPVAPVQGTLALELPHREEAGLLDPPVVGGVATTRTVAGPPDVVPIDRRTQREIDAWAPRFTQAAAEVAAAERPPHQLLRWTSPEVYRDLERRGQLVARARLQDPASGRAATRGVDRRAATPAATASAMVAGRPRVVGTRSCVVSATTVEVSAHVRHGPRSRAVAARFERRADRWVCTALEFA